MEGIVLMVLIVLMSLPESEFGSKMDEISLVSEKLSSSSKMEGMGMTGDADEIEGAGAMKATVMMKVTEMTEGGMTEADEMKGAVS